MISRVTTQTQIRAAQTSLQSNLARLTQLQEQASSLTTLKNPSDDPTRAADSLAVRAQQTAVAQYTRNVDNGTGWLTTADAALSATTNIMNQVRDLTVQGGNGSLSQTAKSALATQLQGLKQDLLTQANTQYLGRSVFAGTSDEAVAFKTTAAIPANGATPAIPATVTYTGTSGSTVERRVAADSTVRVDSNGSKIYGPDTNSVFTLIDNISYALDPTTGTAGATPTATASDYLATVDTRLTTVIAAQSDNGVRQAQIESAGAGLVTKAGTLEAQRSGIEDVDLAQAALDLKLQEVSYQAALSVTAKVLQHTLMDFLQ
ncbi:MULTISPECIES: flagellar hook-associated protein FlgL [unclassified Cryobacterium]|uniref:flagellar hook-associated protein FlgL n=1 Tax=unclassified Cryobacterium TaxID=2649013 RepID=UPI0010699A53|nr:MULTISPECIES: flagellar hook-associated protein FlgL [unclassified Cryobacterium]MEB0201438.1 flagellar hook-associated protein FlgL [Cryobacterium sp. 5I3]MEB0286367.1 flagellar hook-associated protein FlgL [Cryobacterium sp. 10S3]MEB0307016.1 flagellar hook-associated protein FlgL [Cryobacterium sp. 10I1]TFB95273.1 flagellar hook-associated protein 3 [Cryobacterium sp. MDB2-A-1]TFC11308.1 flagellar hook-associated protein 3 [Cryobacterium sp. MDB2-A-2]